MRLVLLTFSAFLALSSNAHACVPPAQSIQLKGATFEEVVSVSYGGRINNIISFKDHVTGSYASVYFDEKVNTMCVKGSDGGSSCQSGLYPIYKGTNQSDIRGWLQLSGQTAYIFSATNGQKDLRKPYLKIDTRSNGKTVPVRIQAHASSDKPLGAVDAEMSITQSLYGKSTQPQQSGSFNLHQSSYSQNTGGCASSFEETPIEEGSGFTFGGQNVPASTTNR